MTKGSLEADGLRSRRASCLELYAKDRVRGYNLPRYPIARKSLARGYGLLTCRQKLRRCGGYEQKGTRFTRSNVDSDVGRLPWMDSRRGPSCCLKAEALETGRENVRIAGSDAHISRLWSFLDANLGRSLRLGTKTTTIQAPDATEAGQTLDARSTGERPIANDAPISGKRTLVGSNVGRLARLAAEEATSSLLEAFGIRVNGCGVHDNAEVKGESAQIGREGR